MCRGLRETLQESDDGTPALATPIGPSANQDAMVSSSKHYPAPEKTAYYAQRCWTYPTRSAPSRIRVELFTRTKNALSRFETLA